MSDYRQQQELEEEEIWLNYQRYYQEYKEGSTLRKDNTTTLANTIIEAVKTYWRHLNRGWKKRNAF